MVHVCRRRVFRDISLRIHGGRMCLLQHPHRPHDSRAGHWHFIADSLISHHRREWRALEPGHHARSLPQRQAISEQRRDLAAVVGSSAVHGSTDFGSYSRFVPARRHHA
mmetsp:Transcript_9325/g.22072  ORF Transcript_9325/g.22072 Transcript_9325/m.22072 type:complete len:109 (-) Transcript_9325:244-570(-)